MTTQPIKSLFANDIYRRIEEVIKVDQTSDDILRDEINEYVVTDAIRSHYTGIFDAFRETPNKPHEGIAIWERLDAEGTSIAAAGLPAERGRAPAPGRARALRNILQVRAYRAITLAST
jgi:hypothetical protein